MGREADTSRIGTITNFGLLSSQLSFREISGVIGFESNAMLLKELAELEQKQSELAVNYSNNLLNHISNMIKEKHDIDVSIIQEKGDFLEQSFNILKEDDIAIIGRVGERAAEKIKRLAAMLKTLSVGQNVPS
jgi:hypothetical protein